MEDETMDALISRATHYSGESIPSHDSPPEASCGLTENTHTQDVLLGPSRRLTERDLFDPSPRPSVAARVAAGILTDEEIIIRRTLGRQLSTTEQNYI
jgi:hypothetical protein